MFPPIYGKELTVSICATDPVCQLETLIAERVGPQRFKVWFKNATRFTFAEGFVKVGVPNHFIGGWLENHFADTICKAAEDLTGRKLEIAFGVDPDLAKSLRKKQPDSQVNYVETNPDRVARHQKRLGTPPGTPALRGRFEDFVVGTTNRLAYSTALAVAQAPATQFNPLFIHGECGLGKTHLLNAICNAIKELHPELTWLCVTGETFTNHFVYSVRSGERDSFRHRYRNVDVLVIDDIHFLAHKRATQEEFLHTYNSIADLGKQVVMASDAPPQLIGHLSPSLVTRFVSGMVVRIEPPNRELRMDILKRRAARMHCSIPEEVLAYVAERYCANVRELEGALLKLAAMADVSGSPLSVSLARKVLEDMIERTLPVLHLANIESAAAIYFGLTPADLHTARKTRTISLSRGIAMYLARKHTSMSYPEIAAHMGNKDHTTVIQAERRIAKFLAKDEVVRWLTPSGEKEARLKELMEELEGQLGQANGNA